MLSDRDAVMAGLPSAGLLRRAVEVQAFAPKRMRRDTVERVLHELWDEGKVIRREPFDVGLPERWGRAE